MANLTDPAVAAAAAFGGALVALAGVVWAEHHRDGAARQREIRDRRIGDLRDFHTEFLLLAQGFRTELMSQWCIEGLDLPARLHADIGQHLAAARFYAIHLRDDAAEAVLESYRATGAALSAGAMKRRDELLAMTPDQRFYAYVNSGDDDKLEAAAKQVEVRVRDLLGLVDPLE